VIRELKILRRCNSPFIVTFYGAFMNKTDLSIMMEFMDLGTMENIYLKNGPVLEKAVATISAQILQGLIYLYEHYKIVHRGIFEFSVLFNM
jgi:mitogen-activated protein kinase kinase